MSPTERTAAFAGSWYPGSTPAITAEVDGYLAAAGDLAVPGRLIALISPHAGLHYSGPVAAHGYGLLRGRDSLTAVLVGPSHRAAFDCVAVHAHGSWVTPLGRVPVDEDLAEALLDSNPAIVEKPGVHRDEHSLEMQMPFLQRLVPGLRIVPVMMGTQSRGEVDALAAALVEALEGRDDVVIVASSDLSHFEPAEVANRVDAAVVEQVAQYDPDALMRRLETHDNVACGGGPMVSVMKAARALGADQATILNYGDSGDVGEHDKSRVVGYLSAALTAS